MAELKKEHVYRKIRNDIDSSVLKEGDKLLPEREFSKELGVSMSTLRSALHKLEDEGFIKRIRSQGTFISKAYASYDALTCGRIGVLLRADNSGRDRGGNLLSSAVINEIMKKGCQVIQPPCCLQLKQHKQNENSVSQIKNSIIQLQNIVDGFVTDERVPERIVEYLHEDGSKPMVVIGRQSNSAADSIIGNDRNGMMRLLDMTEKLGYQHYVICKLEHSQADIDRFQMLKACLRGHSREVVDGWLGERVDVITKKVIKAIKHVPDGKSCILAFNESLADYLKKQLKRKGYKAGLDVGLVAYANRQLQGKKRKMTSLFVNHENVAEKAVQVLFDRINQDLYREKQVHMLDVELNLGETI